MNQGLCTFLELPITQCNAWSWDWRGLVCIITKILYDTNHRYIVVPKSASYAPPPRKKFCGRPCGRDTLAWLNMKYSTGVTALRCSRIIILFLIIWCTLLPQYSILHDLFTMAFNGKSLRGAQTFRHNCIIISKWTYKEKPITHYTLKTATINKEHGTDMLRT